MKHIFCKIYSFIFITYNYYFIFVIALITGIPLVYELDENIRPVKHYYLADEAQVKAAMEKVANQGKAK